MGSWVGTDMSDVFSFHQGLEYLNMAMAQVTDNPAMADGSSLHHDATQQRHNYLRTYIQPLLRAGKPLDLDHILDQVKTRRLSWFNS